jgi:thioester reductase-like protein
MKFKGAARFQIFNRIIRDPQIVVDSLAQHHIRNELCELNDYSFIYRMYSVILDLGSVPSTNIQPNSLNQLTYSTNTIFNYLSSLLLNYP